MSLRYLIRGRMGALSVGVGVLLSACVVLQAGARDLSNRVVLEKTLQALVDRESGTPLTPQHPVRVASKTKTFVAAAILRLWEEGQLTLDAALVDHLPSDFLQILGRDGYRPEAITQQHKWDKLEDMFRRALTLVALYAMAADLPRPTGQEIVSPDAMLQLLFTRTADIQGGLTEGPAVARDGSIYFSDIPLGEDKGMILRFDPRTMKSSVFATDSRKSNGLIFDAQGRLLACEGADHGGRCVARWDIKTGEREVLVDNFKDKRFNAPNDLCVDRRGRIYFTDPRYLGDEPRQMKHRAVYRIDHRRTVVEITHEVSKPNGIALSPDGMTLYVADHDNGTDRIDSTKPPPPQGVMKIYAFPLGSKGRVNGPRRTIMDFDERKGCDGMCVDQRGNVYLTVRDAGRPGVMVISPQGNEVAFIPTGPPNQSAADPNNPPVGLPSNVEFGIGDESNVLYVTVDRSLYRIKLKVSGFHVQYQ